MENRLYTLEGQSTETLGSWLSSALKAPKISLPSFKVPTFSPPTAPRINISKPVVKPSLIKLPTPKISIPRPKINISTPRVSIPRPRIQTPKINVPRTNFKSVTMPKNPFSQKQRIDESSSYQDFFNEIEQQRENNYTPEPVYSPIEQQEEQSFTQDDIFQEMNSEPVYGYTRNDLLGAIKLKAPKIKLKATKIGKSLNFGRKKPSILQKLTLQKGKTKIPKLSPKEIKTGLAVTGAVAATIVTAGSASPAIVAAAGALGTSAGALVGTAQIVGTASALGSTLFASGSPTMGSAFNTAGAMLNNPTVQQNIPLASNANTAINTGLDYYNTGSGIAETLGLKPPSLGTNSQEFFDLLSNPSKDRALILPPSSEPTTGINPFKNPLTDPSHPLYIPPTGKQGQQGQTKIPSTDRPPMPPSPPSNIGIIIGIGLLGYLFMNKDKKK